MEKEYTIKEITFQGLTYKLPKEIKLTDPEMNLDNNDKTMFAVLLRLLGAELEER